MEIDIGKKLQKLTLLFRLNSYNKNCYMNEEYRKLRSFLSFSLKNDKIYAQQTDTINSLIDLHIKKFAIQN